MIVVQHFTLDLRRFQHIKRQGRKHRLLASREAYGTHLPEQLALQMTYTPQKGLQALFVPCKTGPRIILIYIFYHFPITYGANIRIILYIFGENIYIFLSIFVTYPANIYPDS